MTATGEPIMAQRGELLCCRTWLHAQLMIDQKMVLPISEQDWEAAMSCSHGARFAPDAFPGADCHCEDVAQGFSSL